MYFILYTLKYDGRAVLVSDDGVTSATDDVVTVGRLRAFVTHKPLGAALLLRATLPLAQDTAASPGSPCVERFVDRWSWLWAQAGTASSGCGD